MLAALHLTKSYQKKVVLSDVSFEVAQGEITGLLGLNGSGKSTLIGLVLGFTNGTGEVTFDGRPLRDVQQRHPGQIGFTLQPNSLPGSVSVGAFLKARRRAYRRRLPSTAEILSSVELDVSPRTKIRDLSVGMRQKLALGLAVATEPRYLILDEPTNGLDLAGRLLALDLFRRVARAGGSVLISSHIADDVEAVCDSAIILRHGVVAASGSIRSLTAGLRGETMLVEAADIGRLIEALSSKGLQWSQSGSAIEVDSGAGEDIGQLARLYDIALTRLEPKTQTLSSIYSSIVLSGSDQ